MKSSICMYKNTFIITVSDGLLTALKMCLRRPCFFILSTLLVLFDCWRVTFIYISSACVQGQMTPAHVFLCFSATVCHQGWTNHSVCHGGWSSCRTRCLTVRVRALLSLLRALGSAGHGSVGTGQAPAQGSGLGPPGLPGWQHTFPEAKTFTSFSGLCTC